MTKEFFATIPIENMEKLESKYGVKLHVETNIDNGTNKYYAMLGGYGDLTFIGNNIYAAEKWLKKHIKGDK